MPADLRTVLVGIGDTGIDIILDTGLHERLPTERKTFVGFNTDLSAAKRLVLPRHVATSGSLVSLPIPRWATEAEPPEGHHDDHAPKRPFRRHDRAYLASKHGAEGRHEGALAWVDSASAEMAGSAYDVVLRAIEQVGEKGSAAERQVTVHLVIALFAGRGSGSGGLPILLGMLGDLADTVEGEVKLRTTIAAQLPTVRVTEGPEYRRRTLILFSEVTALAERAIELDAERIRGGWRDGPPWEQFLVFGVPGGTDQEQRGVARNTEEAKRYAASVLYERLAGPVFRVLTAESSRRARLVTERDPGTDLSRLFAATGFAELVFEPAEAVEHATRYLEAEFYRTLGRKARNE